MAKPFIEITVEGIGLQKLIRALAYAESKVIPQEIKKSTKNIERFAKKLIRTGTRSGEHYWGLPKRSSAAGEAPASQSGVLASSIGSSFSRSAKAGTAHGIIGASAPHAFWLEFGVQRKTGYLAPRPFFKPAIEKEIPIMVDRIVERLF